MLQDKLQQLQIAVAGKDAEIAELRSKHKAYSIRSMFYIYPFFFVCVCVCVCVYVCVCVCFLSTPKQSTIISQGTASKLEEENRELRVNIASRDAEAATLRQQLVRVASLSLSLSLLSLFSLLSLSLSLSPSLSLFSLSLLFFPSPFFFPSSFFRFCFY